MLMLFEEFRAQKTCIYEPFNTLTKYKLCPLEAPLYGDCKKTKTCSHQQVGINITCLFAPLSRPKELFYW